MRRKTSLDIQISDESVKAIVGIKEYIEGLPEDKRPLVVIRSITYNQEAFIRDTLEGFVMQQTIFPFVAIVHDDASTDGTAAIILEYAEKYPDIIFPIIEEENQYSKPGGPLTKIMFDACEATGSKYIAFCEGDDYWTDPLKLQKQVDFLESHPDYVICCHQCSFLNTFTGEIRVADHLNVLDYSQDILFEKGYWPIQTLCVLYRANAFDFDEFLQYQIRIDLILFWHLLRKGKGHNLKENMAVYRVHSNGVWSGLSASQQWDFDYRIRKELHRVEQRKDTGEYLMQSIRLHGLGRRTILLKKSKELFALLKAVRKTNGTLFFWKYILKFIIKG